MNVGKYEKGVEFGHTAGTRHGVSNNSWITDPHSKVSGVAAGVFKQVILDTPFVCLAACLTVRRLKLESVNLRIRLWIFHQHSRDLDLVVASAKHLIAWVSNAVFVYFTRTKRRELNASYRSTVLSQLKAFVDRRMLDFFLFYVTVELRFSGDCSLQRNFYRWSINWTVSGSIHLAARQPLLYERKVK